MTVGIYGVIGHATAQRTLGQGMALAGIGLGIGLAAGMGLTHLISTLLFGVTPNDPITFAAVTVMLLTVAAAATLVPAVRATQVDPVCGAGL